MESDTGMDTICCICAELRPGDSCSPIERLPREKYENFIIETESTKNIDGTFKLCTTCKTHIQQQNKKPVRSQKEFLGLLDYPTNFREKVSEVCQPNKRISDEWKLGKLNKAENFLLKMVIPFVRVGHLPRGPYIKVKGDLIMISSDLKESMNKILPLDQNLIGVAFRRKIEYKGHYVEEYVDKNKIHAYFNFLKQFNHLYKDFVFDDEVFNAFESKTMNQVNTEFSAMVKDSEENENDTSCENDNIIRNPGKPQYATNSLIIDKYEAENVKSNVQKTVANKFADMVIQIENHYSSGILENDILLDPDDVIFDEDEEEDTDTFDKENFDNINLDELSIDDLENFDTFRVINHRLQPLLQVNTSSGCKCSVTKVVGSVIDLSAKLSKIQVEDSECVKVLQETINAARDFINSAKESLKMKTDCNHSYNEVTNFLNKMVFNKTMTPRDMKKYIERQTAQINNQLDKISVAPAEHGRWKNWGSDVFLEEKMFPDLFPYGIGGYFSTSFLSGQTMGFSNYIKSRLRSIDSKFRDDPIYLFFLLLVKEMVDTQRSEATFFRKATKAPKLNSKTLNDTKLEFLMRQNNVYNAHKQLRGSPMYYEDVKKRLMAFIRQKGAPTLFNTFSSAEFDWNRLALKLYEIKKKKKFSMEFIEMQTSAWKNKLISENVVLATSHFARRTNKLMSILTKQSFIEHGQVKYKVINYFYRVEFQARGAPHLHCMFWLEGENGETPPSLYSDEDTDAQEIISKISDFAKACMSGSHNDISCAEHKIQDDSCEDCQELKHLVQHYQTHSHRPTCLKKNKVVKIKSTEGHGKLDGVKEGEDLLIKSCRYNFLTNH